MRSKSVPATAAAFVMIMSGPASAALYTFPFPSGSTVGSTATYRAANTQNWTASHRSGTTVTDLSAAAPDGNTSSPNQIGFGNNYGAGGTASNSTYLFSISDGTNQIFAASTTFATEAATAISWDMGNTPASTTLVRVLIQSGGSWYVSQSTYSSASSTTLPTFQNSPVNFSLSLGSALWNQYDFATMTIGSAAVPVSNDLTGVGFHITNGSNDSYTRLDNVNVVPEPAAGLLGLVGAISLTALRRRSR